MKEWSELPI